MKTVFFDVDTQIDFLYPAGALHAPGAERIVERIAALNRWAGEHGVVVISTMDAHAENDPEFRDWPPHCVAGTAPQAKPLRTLLEKRVVIPSAPAQFSLAEAQQIIIEKQHLDCFTNANLVRVLDQLGAERFLVYGVVTEVCVKFAAFGLLETGKPVEIVTDAVQALDETQAQRVLRDFESRGGKLITVPRAIAGQ